jgi:hypothetical protein
MGRFDVLRYRFIERPPSVFVPILDGREAHIGVGPTVGLDVYLGRKLSLSLDSQATIVDDDSSIDTWVSLGWTFGGR